MDRTRIAAMALQGLLANPKYESGSYENDARQAIAEADALLAELARTEPKSDNKESLEREG